MFRNEVGNDTKQMDYGNNGGQNYMINKKVKINLLSSKAFDSFTLIGLTAATGDPVLCKFILAGKRLNVTDVKGLYSCGSISYILNKTVEKNMGEVKKFPVFSA